MTGARAGPEYGDDRDALAGARSSFNGLRNHISNFTTTIRRCCEARDFGIISSVPIACLDSRLPA